MRRGPADRLVAIGRRLRRLAGTGLLVLACAAPATAGPREQAKRMHDRLVGVPPTEAVLTSMAARIAANDAIGAAYEAMQNRYFYTSALKNFVTPWTNVDRTVFADLNDYTATVIGMIRDDVPFNTVLSADLVYVGAPGVVGTAYSHTNNDHYRQLEANRVNLGDPTRLVPVLQSSLPGAVLAPTETAGVVTTRAAGEAFFSAGTNRRMWRFTTMNFLCRDMEQLKDVSRPTDRIRQDVSRSPGGDSSVFHNHCTGCHSGMDPMAGAYAYYEWDATAQRIVYSRGQVQAKNLINANTFPFGYITIDDRWDNYWRTGPIAVLGWRGTESGGFGAKSLGREVAASRAFSVCQVEKAFAYTCFRPVGSADDRAAVETIADVFEAGNYSMKRVLAETAAYCMGN
ncbi:MAG TPA: hypothetical protein VII72_04920 [Myxococcota bacterium]